MNKKYDLTSGNVSIQLVKFSLPIVLGSLFQQLYNLIDTILISKYIGMSGVAAIGIYYPLDFLILGSIQACCLGFSVPLSQSIGKKDEKAIKNYFINNFLLCSIMAIVLTVILLCLCPLILRLLRTPSNLFCITQSFVKISFLTIPIVIMFDFVSNVIIGFGDTKHPTYFSAISLIINIILDFVFMKQFTFGISGAAWATLISEFVSGIFCFQWLFGQIHFKLIGVQIKINIQYIKEMLVIGVPMAIEYSFSALGAIILQLAINSLGSSVITAQAAAEKIRQLFTLPMESIGTAMATYTAQNYGASKISRIVKGVKSCSILQICYSCVALIIVLKFNKQLLILIIGTSNKTVFKLARKYLLIVSFFFSIHGLLQILRYTLQGLGHSLIAIFSGVGELLGRFISSWLALNTVLKFSAICLSNQLAWFIALVYCLVMFKIIFPKDVEVQKN